VRPSVSRDPFSPSVCQAGNRFDNISHLAFIR